jgi:hypothetical protein
MRYEFARLTRLGRIVLATDASLLVGLFASIGWKGPTTLIVTLLCLYIAFGLFVWVLDQYGYAVHRRDPAKMDVNSKFWKM